MYMYRLIDFPIRELAHEKKSGKDGNRYNLHIQCTVHCIW